jgi:hypothetical protein
MTAENYSRKWSVRPPRTSVSRFWSILMILPICRIRIALVFLAVAVVRAGNHSQWAHFAQLRIIAYIMSSDEAEFWRLTEEEREQLYIAFRSTAAQAIIAEPPPDLAGLLDARSKQVGTTAYYYLLPP